MILNSNDFKFSLFQHSIGNGGEILQLTDKKDKNVSFLVKRREMAQSIAENVAQQFLRAIGLPAIQVAWIKFDTVPYGGVRYIPNLTRIDITHMENLSPRQKQLVIIFICLGKYMNNPDMTEMYLTPDGIVCSLDYGETMLGSFNTQMALLAPVNISSEPNCFGDTPVDKMLLHYRSNLEFCKQYIKSAVDFTVSDIEAAAIKSLKLIADFDIGKLDDCFSEMLSIFPKPTIVQAYQDWFTLQIETATEALIELDY